MTETPSTEAAKDAAPSIGAHPTPDDYPDPGPALKRALQRSTRTVDVERAREPIKNVGSGFSAFLRSEMSCEASGCHWLWFAKGSDHYVGCSACGSLYPWRDTYYLRRIYEAEGADSWHPIDELPPNHVAFLGGWQRDTAGRPVWQYAKGLLREDRSVEWLSSDPMLHAKGTALPTHFHPQLSPPAPLAGFVPFDKVAIFARDQGVQSAAHWLEARAADIRDNGPKSEEGVLDAIAGAHAGALLDAAAELRALARASAGAALPEYRAGSR